jgi:glycerophosphoryl diester phosphodiesterase
MPKACRKEDAMRRKFITCTLAAVIVAGPIVTPAVSAHDWEGEWHGDHARRASVQLGPRPFYLVDKMKEGGLKRKLESCAAGPFYQTDFSIGHRGGAPLQFPEHTKESHEAGARMGAGILECDVTFTNDRQLVCRHDQCDLHTTTNILVTPLAAKCSVPFTPAEFDTSGNRIKAASALCCTSDLTLEEFKSLKGKMDASYPNAKTPEEYLGGTASWRTDLYSTGGTLLTHKESIQLLKSLGAKFTPELKGENSNKPGSVAAVFGSQEAYAQAMIDEYTEARIPPQHVWAQSFNLKDVLYWIKHEPRFGKQAVYLDDRYETITPPLNPNDPSTWKPTMQELAAWGVQIIAPPMPILLTVENGKIVPSKYAKAAKAAGLDIITWTIERSDLRNGASKAGFYYAFDPTGAVIKTDGDMFVALDVLAKQVGILGIFSDWAATVTYYANCMGLK